MNADELRCAYCSLLIVDDDKQRVNKTEYAHIQCALDFYDAFFQDSNLNVESCTENEIISLSVFSDAFFAPIDESASK